MNTPPQDYVDLTVSEGTAEFCGRGHKWDFRQNGICTGTTIDATFIKALGSTKNRERQLPQEPGGRRRNVGQNSMS
ncbi:MAG: hypothetical protein ACYYK0_06125 [Candidatus Eutrophobiaceae bacterium]